MKQPIQPLYQTSEQSIIRFRPNKLVRYLVNNGDISFNDLARLPGISPDDWMQLAMLIGYSLDGFRDLHYVSKEVADIAEAMLKEGKPFLEARAEIAEKSLREIRDDVRNFATTILETCGDDLEG